MATEAEVKKVIQSLDPKSVSIDASGRIVIEDDNAKKALLSFSSSPPSQKSVDPDFMDINIYKCAAK